MIKTIILVSIILFCTVTLVLNGNTLAPPQEHTYYYNISKAEFIKQHSININSATVKELTDIPGIGTVTAESIVAYRDSIGGFNTYDELLEVSGVGEVRATTLREWGYIQAIS